MFENTAFPEHFVFGTPLFSLPHVLQQGPCRALRYSRAIGQDYDRHLADIDAIKEKRPERFCVCGLAPELYLYADLPYSTYSSWTWRETSFFDRQVQYWKLHPDALPTCVYIPVDQTYNNHGDAAEQLQWIQNSFDPLCDYTAEQGQGGYIVYVSQWHLDAETVKQ